MKKVKLYLYHYIGVEAIKRKGDETIIECDSLGIGHDDMCIEIDGVKITFECGEYGEIIIKGAEVEVIKTWEKK